MEGEYDIEEQIRKAAYSNVNPNTRPILPMQISTKDALNDVIGIRNRN
jgi:hypothetical protein